MLTFRNSREDLVDIPTVPATQVKDEFGAILEKATGGGAVAITLHDAPKAVLLSYDEFESLVQVRSYTLDNLGTEFDELLDRMQNPRARKGMQSAFHASPAKLSRAATKVARKETVTVHDGGRAWEAILTMSSPVFMFLPKFPKPKLLCACHELFFLCKKLLRCC
jgi:prevent-host-death family protein